MNQYSEFERVLSVVSAIITIIQALVSLVDVVSPDIKVNISWTTSVDLSTRLIWLTVIASITSLSIGYIILIVSKWNSAIAIFITMILLLLEYNFSTILGQVIFSNGSLEVYGVYLSQSVFYIFTLIAIALLENQLYVYADDNLKFTLVFMAVIIVFLMFF